MNVLTLTDSLQTKSKENKEKVEETIEKQKSLMLNVKNFNFKLRNFMESDVMQKNMIRESHDKINNIKIRIQNTRLLTKNIRDKMERIKGNIQEINNN